MKEFTNIHLARTPFMIEPEARRQLADYLEDVQAALGGTEDDMMEIELRIIEILHEHGVHKEQVIIQRDVNAIMQQLGSPSVFYSSIDEEAQARRSQDSHKPLGFWGNVRHRFALTDSGRRLMRDTNNAVLSGVLAGISARYNIPLTLLRILVVLASVVSMGLLLPEYIILAAVIPPTKSTADRLALKGLPLTRANLQREAFKPVATPLGILILRIIGIVILLGALVTITSSTANVLIALAHGNLLAEIPAAHHGFAIVSVILGVCLAICLFISAVLGIIALQRGKLPKGMRNTIIACLVASGIIFAAITSLVLAMTHTINTERRHAVEQTKEQTTVQLAGLADAKSLTVTGQNGKQISHIGYKEVEASKEPYIEITSLRGQKTLTATASAEEDGTRLALAYDGACNDLFTGDTCEEEVSATIYGPKLSSLTWDNISGGYYTAGATEGRTMNVALKHEGLLTMRATGMTGIEADVSDTQRGKLTIEGYVENIGITGKGQGTVILDSAKQVAIKTPDTCGKNDNQLQITYNGKNRPEKISYNDQDVTGQDSLKKLELGNPRPTYYRFGSGSDANCHVFWRELRIK